ncbi:MAG: DUF5683 domain-containing protein [Bacteroidales bacterium]|nr:DUF5683 domain-containing protein [Bacteroidales bacterium]
MNFIRKPYMLLWMICSFLTVHLYAQNLEESLSFADKQFELKNYSLALKEYQRVLFFNDGKNLDYIYHQIAKVYFINGYYQDAARNYELAYKTARDDSLKTEFIFKKAACYMLEHKFRLAIFELMNLPDSSDIQYNNRKNFYFAVCYWGLEEFEKSKKYFLSIIPENRVGNREKITLLFSKKKKLYRPNPKTAKIMSMILPGSGQIYSGDIKNGLNSMVLTGGFVILGIYMNEYYTFFDAFLTAAPWFMRYYQGGYQKAEQIATQKRAIRRNKTYKAILQLMKQ